MATHDNSLASQVEAWIVATLVALDEFAADAVEMFPGTNRPTGEQLIAEMLAHRSPYVAVLFEGDRASPLQEGAQAYAPIYGIYVVVQNERPAASRTGDGTTIGTNGLRDVIRTALDNKMPAQSAGGYGTDYAHFNGVRIVLQRKDAFAMRAELIVDETPTG